MDAVHLDTAALQAGLDHIIASPSDNGTLEMIVARPAEDKRNELTVATLSAETGLTGNDWSVRGSAKVDAQLTLMNSRAVDLLAGERSRWGLAGDQLYVEFDLAESNVPAGTRLKMGQALLEVTALAHNGCSKFADRYGKDALKFVNSPQGKALHLRGVYAKVVEGGEVRVGDRIVKV